MSAVATLRRTMLARRLDFSCHGPADTVASADTTNARLAVLERRAPMPMASGNGSLSRGNGRTTPGDNGTTRGNVPKSRGNACGSWKNGPTPQDNDRMNRGDD